MGDGVRILWQNELFRIVSHKTNTHIPTKSGTHVKTKERVEQLVLALGRAVDAYVEKDPSWAGKGEVIKQNAGSWFRAESLPTSGQLQDIATVLGLLHADGRPTSHASQREYNQLQSLLSKAQASKVKRGAAVG